MELRLVTEWTRSCVRTQRWLALVPLAYAAAVLVIVTWGHVWHLPDVLVLTFLFVAATAWEAWWIVKRTVAMDRLSVQAVDEALIVEGYQARFRIPWSQIAHFEIDGGTTWFMRRRRSTVVAVLRNGSRLELEALRVERLVAKPDEQRAELEPYRTALERFGSTRGMERSRRRDDQTSTGSPGGSQRTSWADPAKARSTSARPSEKCDQLS